jgi:hypothetical protein
MEQNRTNDAMQYIFGLTSRTYNALSTYFPCGILEDASPMQYGADDDLRRWASQEVNVIPTANILSTFAFVLWFAPAVLGLSESQQNLVQKYSENKMKKSGLAHSSSCPDFSPALQYFFDGNKCPLSPPNKGALLLIVGIVNA